MIAIGALYWGINFLKGSNLFDNKRYFYAIYSHVDGLSPSRPVNINGFQVGQVSEIYFHPDGSGRLVVKIKMTNDFRVPANTEARIYSTDLLGEKAVELALGDSPELARPGDTLISDVQLSLTEEVNRQVAPLKEKAENLISSIDTVMILASGFLNEETRNNFTETFESIRRSFLTLEHSVSVFDTTLSKSQQGLITSVDNLAKVTTSLEESRDELAKTFTNLESISDSLSQVRFKKTFSAIEEASVNARDVLQKANEGDGSIGQLLNDPKLYKNLAEASEQLNLLLLDLKYNPNRYVNFSVFGGSKRYSLEEMLELEREKEKLLEEHREKEAAEQAGEPPENDDKEPE